MDDIPAMSGKLVDVHPRRMAEIKRKDSLLVQHLNECWGTSRAFDWRIIDQCIVPQELMYFEPLNLAQKNPWLITSDKYHSQDFFDVEILVDICKLFNSKITL